MRRTNFVNIFQLQINFWLKSGGLRPKKAYATGIFFFEIFRRNFENFFFSKLSILTFDGWFFEYVHEIKNDEYSQSGLEVIGAL